MPTQTGQITLADMSLCFHVHLSSGTMLDLTRKTHSPRWTKVLTRLVSASSIQLWCIQDTTAPTFKPLSSHVILSFFLPLDMEANIAREKYTRICANIAEQFRLLENQKNKRSERELEVICDRLVKQCHRTIRNLIRNITFQSGCSC